MPVPEWKSRVSGDEGHKPPQSLEEGTADDSYREAIVRHAQYLGIDPVKDAAYMWIAEEALDADVPEGWITGEGEGEYEGLIYYYKEETGESTWDHPLDDYYRQKFLRRKARDERRAREADRSPSRHRSSPRPVGGRRGDQRTRSGSESERCRERRRRRKGSRREGPSDAGRADEETAGVSVKRDERRESHRSRRDRTERTKSGVDDNDDDGQERGMGRAGRDRRSRGGRSRDGGRRRSTGSSSRSASRGDEHGRHRRKSRGGGRGTSTSENHGALGESAVGRESADEVHGERRDSSKNRKVESVASKSRSSESTHGRKGAGEGREDERGNSERERGERRGSSGGRGRHGRKDSGGRTGSPQPGTAHRRRHGGEEDSVPESAPEENYDAVDYHSTEPHDKASRNGGVSVRTTDVIARDESYASREKPIGQSTTGEAANQSSVAECRDDGSEERRGTRRSAAKAGSAARRSRLGDDLQEIDLEDEELRNMESDLDEGKGEELEAPRGPARSTKVGATSSSSRRVEASDGEPDNKEEQEQRLASGRRPGHKGVGKESPPKEEEMGARSESESTPARSATRTAARRRNETVNESGAQVSSSSKAADEKNRRSSRGGRSNREGTGRDDDDPGGDASSPPPSREADESRRERTDVERRSDAELSPKRRRSEARAGVQAVVEDEEEPWPEAEPVRRGDRGTLAAAGSSLNGELANRFRSFRAGDSDFSRGAALDRGASGGNVDGGIGGVSFGGRQGNQIRSSDREILANEGWPHAGWRRGDETREGDPPRQPCWPQVSQGGAEGWQAHHARRESSEFSAPDRSSERGGGWKQISSDRNGDGQRGDGGIVGEDRGRGERGGERGWDQDRWRASAGDRREDQAAVRHAQELREKIAALEASLSEAVAGQEKARFELASEKAREALLQEQGAKVHQENAVKMAEVEAKLAAAELQAREAEGRIAGVETKTAAATRQGVVREWESKVKTNLSQCEEKQSNDT